MANNFISRMMLAALAACLTLIPQTGAALSWPANVTSAQKVQVLKYEAKSLQTLLKNSKCTGKITAGGYVAVNLSDNSVMLGKNAEKQYSIASVTKLMNALIVEENIDRDKKITITQKMLVPYGSSPCFFSGLSIKADLLLRASLIQSVNDASESLSYYIGKEKFVSMMNRKAKEIGMKNTFFADPHGLSAKNRSTASDLAKLISYINKNHRNLLDITKDNNFWLTDAKGQSMKFRNLNDFYHYPEFIGGKTGYLPQSKQTFAGMFDIGGKPIAIIVLYSPNYQADTFRILNELKK